MDIWWKVSIPLIECLAATHFQFIVNSFRYTLYILRELYAYANLPLTEMCNLLCYQICKCFLNYVSCFGLTYSNIIGKNLISASTFMGYLLYVNFWYLLLKIWDVDLTKFFQKFFWYWFEMFPASQTLVLYGLYVWLHWSVYLFTCITILCMIWAL